MLFLDVSQNEIRNIRKKTLSHLLHLNLADNKLKDIDGLEAPKIKYLNLANNRRVLKSTSLIITLFF